MGIDPSIVWDFAGEVVGRLTPVRRSVPATVTRVDPDGTVWATTGDGTEAPAASASAGVEPGDVVDVEWSGAEMRITGNASDPAPSGSVMRRLTQHAQSVADAASKVANAVNQHFFADGNGIHVTAATQDDWNTSHTGANVLINSVGQLFRDGLVNLLTITTESGARALTIWDGLGNTAEHVRAVIGETIKLGVTGAAQVLISSTGLSLYAEDGKLSQVTDSSGTAIYGRRGTSPVEVIKIKHAVSGAYNVGRMEFLGSSSSIEGRDDNILVACENDEIAQAMVMATNGSGMDAYFVCNTEGVAGGDATAAIYAIDGTTTNTLAVSASDGVAANCAMSAPSVTASTSISSDGTITAGGVIRASGGEVRLYATSSYIYLRDDNGIGWRFSKSGAHIHCCTDGTNWVTVI